jgi:hypothetical protein
VPQSPRADGVAPTQSSMTTSTTSSQQQQAQAMLVSSAPAVIAPSSSSSSTTAPIANASPSGMAAFVVVVHVIFVSFVLFVALTGAPQSPTPSVHNVLHYIFDRNAIRRLITETVHSQTLFRPTPVRTNSLASIATVCNPETHRFVHVLIDPCLLATSATVAPAATTAAGGHVATTSEQ